MSSTEEIFFDIETDWFRRLTVVGFYAQSTGVVQLVGADISTDRLLKELPTTGQLYTYNGHSFDLPCVRKALGVNLRERFASVDLRYPCRKRGLTGGQKAIERVIGVRRELPDMDGRDAIYLWERYQRGDLTALATLLRYNREDLNGLVAIKAHLSGGGA